MSGSPDATAEQRAVDAPLPDAEGFDALHAATWQALQADDLDTAQRLALSMPPAEPHTAARIAHMLIATAFRLESTAAPTEACALYAKAVEDEGLAAADRCNAALRLAMLVAECDCAAATRYLKLAVESPDDPVHSAASWRLADLLLGSRDWAECLSVCASDRIQDAELKLLLQIRSVQCRAHLRQLSDDAEAEALALPPALGAHAAAWSDAALACELTENYPVARVLYEKLLRADGLPPDIRANAQLRLGSVLDRMMLWSEAEPYLAEASRSPDAWPATRVHARYRLANLYYLLDKFDLAEGEFEKLRSDLAADPPLRADAQLKHGVCCFRLERFDEAARDFRTCRAIGGEIEVKAELMLAEIAETRRDFAAARESYNRVIQHPEASPLTKTGAYQRVRGLPRR